MSMMLVPIIVAKKSTIEALDMKLLVALPCSFTVTTSAHTQTECKSQGIATEDASWREGGPRAFRRAVHRVEDEANTKNDDVERASTPVKGCRRRYS